MFSTSSKWLVNMEIHKLYTGGVAEAGPLAGGDGAVHYDSCAGLWARAARPVGTGFLQPAPDPCSPGSKPARGKRENRYRATGRSDARG